MTTLDRYIARQYLFNVLALMVLLFCFVVAVDVSLNIDRFLHAADKLMGSHGEASAPAGISGGVRRILLTVLAVADLWWPRLLQLFTYMVGLALVGAMGFTLTQMVRHRELVAVVAGGISLRRVAVPMLVVAAGFMGLKILDQEFVLCDPRIAPLLTRDHGDIGDRNWSAFPVRLVRDVNDRIFFAQNFDPSRQAMVGVHIWEREKNGLARRQITADAAVWKSSPPPAAHAIGSSGGAAGAATTEGLVSGGGWELVNPSVVSLQLAPSGAPGTAMDAGPVPNFIQTDLDPATLLLKRYASFSQSLSWRQISRTLASPRISPDLRDRLERVRFARISTALASLLSLIVSMPFFLIREPKDMLVQSLKCAPIGIAAMLGGTIGAVATVPGLPPGFAAFLPVLVLIPVAIAAASWVRT